MTRIDPATIPGRNCATGSPDDWFSPEGEYIHPAAARRLCAGCPALDACLEWALVFEEGCGHSARAGIYGGMTPRQRAQLATRRRADARGAS